MKLSRRPVGRLRQARDRIADSRHRSPPAVRQRRPRLSRPCAGKRRPGWRRVGRGCGCGRSGIVRPTSGRIARPCRAAQGRGRREQRAPTSHLRRSPAGRGRARRRQPRTRPQRRRPGPAGCGVVLLASVGIWPQFSDGVCPAWRRFGGPGRLPAGLPCVVKGLLVVQRLSMPAVLPGVRGVIVAR
jgi:hypothetical protein